MPQRTLLFVFAIVLLASCNRDNPQREAEVRKQCDTMQTVNGLTVYFYGFFPEDADTIQVQLIRNGDTVLNKNAPIPRRVEDSLRHQRTYRFDYAIQVQDTVVFSIPGYSQRVHGFAYEVQPLCDKFNCDYGCSLIYKIDGEAGGSILFKKQGWDLIDRKDFRSYYNR